MSNTPIRLFGYCMAVLCLLGSVGVVFFASFEQLARSGGLRNRGGGDFFVGLVLVLGEFGARLFVGAILFGLAYLLWRAVSTPRKRGRRAS